MSSLWLWLISHQLLLSKTKLYYDCKTSWVRVSFEAHFCGRHARHTQYFQNSTCYSPTHLRMQYSSGWPFLEAILLTYIRKKHPPAAKIQKQKRHKNALHEKSIRSYLKSVKNLPKSVNLPNNKNIKNKQRVD